MAMDNKKRPKVLMVTMGLDIGGAETHIVELSKELKNMGCDVLCCSNGGVYVESLKEHGIKHFTAPLHQRSFKTMCQSYQTLKQIVKTEKPDIIHAHARIPALVSSFISFFYKIPMVTSVHFNFKVSPILKFMTRWGKHTLSVSDDLKNYLIENYHISEDNITITVNGINTNVFSPQTDASDILNEFSFRRDDRFLVSVCRLDKNACESAFLLLDCALSLKERYKNLQIVIVGRGDALSEITQRADALNQKGFGSFVTITGGRTDVYKFCALAHLFVGVSRAALEAMACEKPAILAGNQGYLGLYTPEKLPECIRTNFTCRGIPYPNQNVLYDEIVRTLDMPENELQKIAEYSRETVRKYYSVEKMASDALGVYETIIASSRPIRDQVFDFTILGYYGFNNSGDDALLYTIVKDLREKKPNVRLCVLTNMPEKCSRDLKVFSVHRFDIFRVLSAVKHSKVFIFGGGNLIQDVTSTKSLFYYIYILKAAQKFGAKTMLYANGIGPVTKAHNARLTSKILNKVDIITLRERLSLEFLKKYEITKPKIVVTADEALITAPSDKEQLYILLENEKLLHLGPYFLVSIRDFPQAPSNFCEIMASALDYLSAKTSSTALFLPLHIPDDIAISEKIASLMKEKSMVLKRAIDASQVAALMKESLLVVGMRLHSIIYATIAETPFIAISYDEKVRAFCELVDENSLVELKDIAKCDFKALIDNALKYSAETKTTLSLKKEKLIERAKENSSLALELLESAEKENRFKNGE